MFNFQSEIELMKLRAESRQERYRSVDGKMEEIIDNKFPTGRDMMKCCGERNEWQTKQDPNI